MHKMKRITKGIKMTEGMQVKTCYLHRQSHAHSQPHPLNSIMSEKATRGRDGASKLMSDMTTTGTGWCLPTTTNLQIIKTSSNNTTYRCALFLIPCSPPLFCCINLYLSYYIYIYNIYIYIYKINVPFIMYKSTR